MLNSFLAAAAAGATLPAASTTATQSPARRQVNRVATRLERNPELNLELNPMVQPSLSVRSDRVEDWREPSTPILATEASRAFVPPCTRALRARAAALGPVAPCVEPEP